jgi:hypothetical protein
MTIPKNGICNGFIRRNATGTDYVVSPYSKASLPFKAEFCSVVGEGRGTYCYLLSHSLDHSDNTRSLRLKI